MYLQSITITFTRSERQRVEELMNNYRLEKESRYKKSDQIFKQTLMAYLAQAKGKQEVIQQLRNLLKQKKIQIENQENIYGVSYELAKALRQLKKYIREKQNDSECYTFYISFMNQLKDMKPQNLSLFQSNLNTIKALNVFEKNNIKWAAQKIIKLNETQQKIHNIEAVSKVLTQILRYGFHGKITSLQQIKDSILLQKFQALIKNIENNYIEIQPTYKYGTYNTLKQFMQKIVIRGYQRQDLQKLIQQMPYNLKSITQPLLQYVLTLRQNAGQKSMPLYIRGGVYQSYQLKKAQQQSIEQLISDFSTVNKKNDKLQVEISNLKQFITWLSNLKSSPKQKESNEEISKYIQRCQGEDLQHSLLKIYQKVNNYGYKQPLYKTFRQSRENELLNEKLNKKIAKLEEEITNYKKQNYQLDQQKAQCLEQRIQLLQTIQQYKETVEQKNIQINKFQATIQLLKKVQEEKRELQNVKKLLQEREDQRSAHLLIEKNKNKEYKQIIDRSIREKQQLIKQNTSLVRQLQNHKQQLKLKAQRVGNRSQTQISRNLDEKIRNPVIQMYELQNQNNPLNTLIAKLRLQNQQLNIKLADMQDLKIVAEQLNKQNDVLSNKLEILIKTKEIALEKGSFLNKCEQDLQAQIGLLKTQIEILTNNQLQTRERERQCELQLDNLKNLFQGLLQEHQKKQKIIKQLEFQNQNLQKEIVRIRNLNQELPNFRIRQEQSNRQNKYLQNELEQAKKLNELIKTQYLNFKDQSKNAFKVKLDEEIIKYKQNQEKLRENYRKLHELFLAQKEKIIALKTENQKLTKDKIDTNSKQFISLKYLTQKSQLQERYKDLIQKYQSLKTFNQRQLIKKQQQIANLKLQVIRYERNSLNEDDLNNQKIIKQKLEYLQGEVYELNEQNSRMRMQLQRKEQQILILKTQALK